MLRNIIVTVTAIVLLVAGCQTTPDTPRQQLYAASAMYAATADTTKELLQTDVITTDQAREVLETLRRFKPAIETAREALRNNESIPDDTMDQLRTMQSELAEVQARLAEQRKEAR